MSRYRRSGDGHGSVRLSTPALALTMHRRPTGWGWAVLQAPDGAVLGVLEHLGEVLLRDQDPPARLEAAEVRRETGPAGERLVLEVASAVAADTVRGTSFEKWVGLPAGQPVLTGAVTLTLPADEPCVRLSWRLRSHADCSVGYVRGPWLRAGDGEGSFGQAKVDAMLPGVDWAVDQEWTSGPESFRDPWALRVAPHPRKVTAPVMAVSHGGWAVGLTWEPNQQSTGWFNQRRHVPQAVMASPDFVNRRASHLMGLMLPSAQTEAEENQLRARPGMELHLHQRIELDAELVVVPGRSLDVLVDWTRRHGLPTSTERWPAQEALDRIARAYTENLWHEGRGFGVGQREGDVGPDVPRFLDDYVARDPGAPLARELARRAAWCRREAGSSTRGNVEVGAHELEELLASQRDDGTFRFEPDGRHYRKDDVLVARDLVDPMGQEGDSALDLTVVPALRLLDLWRGSGDERAAEAARRALDACHELYRPEGGDFWETPLHAPNLLAAGHAAVAYEVAYRELGEPRYRDRAVHWIRSLLPFTHLWEPDDRAMLYDTKPCLCSSDWYFANWVRDHVQWEVLETFAESRRRGIDWASVDTVLDWATYHHGVTFAAVRWLLDHREGRWMPHNLPASWERYLAGGFDTCLPDTHNSVTGLYGGMAIAPDAVALNLLALLEMQPPSGR